MGNLVDLPMKDYLANAFSGSRLMESFFQCYRLQLEQLFSLLQPHLTTCHRPILWEILRLRSLGTMSMIPLVAKDRNGFFNNVDMMERVSELNVV